MAQLLIELYSEEIPARMQPSGAEELKRLVAAGLADAELDFEEAEAYATPRRLVLVVKGLPEKQPDVREEKRGPRADAPDKAINGFLRANGITLADCERRDTDRGEFLFAVIERNGRATADVLPEILSASIDNMTWPKSMRWGEGKMRWVRPLIRVLCAFDGAAVPLKPAGGVPCGNLTSGHPVHAPEEFDVGYFKDYRAGLYRNKVIVDAAERKRVIMERATELAEAEGLTPRDDRVLLDEVAGLVEWPVTLIGTIDEAYMDLPDEALELGGMVEDLIKPQIEEALEEFVVDCTYKGMDEDGAALIEFEFEGEISLDFSELVMAAIDMQDLGGLDLEADVELSMDIEMEGKGILTWDGEAGHARAFEMAVEIIIILDGVADIEAGGEAHSVEATIELSAELEYEMSVD